MQGTHSDDSPSAWADGAGTFGPRDPSAAATFFSPSLHELVIATVLCAIPVKALLGYTIQAQRWNYLSHFVQLKNVGELSQS